MLANEFAAHALELCPNVVMLLRLAFLESERRSPILDGAGLRRVFVFRKRLPMMHRDGWEGRKASSGLAFAWFVWERGYRGHPITQRISWEDGRDTVPVLLPHRRPTKGSRAGSQIKRGANRAYVLARLHRDGRADLIEKVESGALSVRGALVLGARRIAEIVGTKLRHHTHRRPLMKVLAGGAVVGRIFKADAAPGRK
jgi:hypothetical protein